MAIDYLEKVLGWLAPLCTLGAFTANFYVFFSYRLIGKPRSNAAFSACQRKRVANFWQ